MVARNCRARRVDVDRRALAAATTMTTPTRRSPRAPNPRRPSPLATPHRPSDTSAAGSLADRHVGGTTYEPTSDSDRRTPTSGTSAPSDSRRRPSPPLNSTNRGCVQRAEVSPRASYRENELIIDGLGVRGARRDRPSHRFAVTEAQGEPEPTSQTNLPATYRFSRSGPIRSMPLVELDGPLPSLAELHLSPSRPAGSTPRTTTPAVSPNRARARRSDGDVGLRSPCSTPGSRTRPRRRSAERLLTVLSPPHRTSGGRGAEHERPRSTRVSPPVTGLSSSACWPRLLPEARSRSRAWFAAFRLTDDLFASVPQANRQRSRRCERHLER